MTFSNQHKSEMINPFTPGFGCYPSVVMGRDEIIDEFIEALDGSKPGCQDKYPLFSGNRGVGKTVMLGEITKILQERGFFIYRCDAAAGITDKIIKALLGKKKYIRRNRKEFSPVAEVVNGDTTYKFAGFSFASEKEIDEFDIDLSEAIIHKLSERKCNGVAIIVDEVSRLYIEELRRIALTIQTVASDNYNVIMAAAGVAENIDELEDDKTISFTRRMHRIDVDSIKMEDARDGIKKTLEQHNMQIDDDVLDMIATATEGYPFVIQRIAYDTWRQAHKRNPNHIHIIESDFENATPDFISRIYKSIVEPTLRNLSDIDKKFLKAMSEDHGGASKISDIAKRMDKDRNYINLYRARLIKKDIIEADKYGYVSCKIPYLLLYISNDDISRQLCGKTETVRSHIDSNALITNNLKNLGYDI